MLASAGAEASLTRCLRGWFLKASSLGMPFNSKLITLYLSFLIGINSFHLSVMDKEHCKCDMPMLFKDED